MAPKNKQQPQKKEDLYFVVRDKSSRHHIFDRHQLNYDKKDNLKIGSNATFSSHDDPSGHSQCTIVMSGTKQQCDNTLSLLDKALDTNRNQNLNDKEKSRNENDSVKGKKKNVSKPKANNNVNSVDKSQKRKNDMDVEKLNKKNRTIISHTTNDKENLNDDIAIVNTSDTTQRDITRTKVNDINRDEEEDERDSEPSSRLFIDDKVENNDDDDHSSDEEVDQGSSVVTIPKESQQFTNLNTLTNQDNTVAADTNNNGVVSGEDELSAILNFDLNSKTSTKISNRDYQKLKNENIRLKKAIDVYKNSWMPRPSGATANYFISIGKILSGTTDEQCGEEEKGDVLENIKFALNMTERELKSCEHDSDITKTCRKITKHLYPDPKMRSKMLISSMDPAQLRAIQMYARLVHPVQAKIANSILNNAIGNVFATEKIRTDNNETSDTIEEDI